MLVSQGKIFDQAMCYYESLTDKYYKPLALQENGMRES